MFLKKFKIFPGILAFVIMLTLLTSCFGGNETAVVETVNENVVDVGNVDNVSENVGVPDVAPVSYEAADFDEFFDKIVALNQALSLMSWDIETYGAPVDAYESRSKAMAILDAELFAMGISDKMQAYFEFVENAKERGEADDVMLAIYRLSKEDYDKFMCIPADEYQAFSELTLLAAQNWERAKEESDFSIFAPYLQQVMDYNRKIVDYRAAAGMVYDNPYDAKLDDFESGMTVAQLDVFFEELRAEIVPLLQKITAAAQERENEDFLKALLSREVPISVQKNISNLLMNTVNFDLNRGSLAESAHPFSTGIGTNDTRITTNYHENDAFASFFSTLHESGHALYMQNADEKVADTILGHGISMGMHESQSRFLENIVGRSYEFWEAFYDDFISASEGYYDDVSMQDLYEAANLVEPSLIRIRADELTYSLHIMVRYEIEKLIMNDHEIKAEDLPAIWNEKMQEYLGVTPENDAEGILQDIHWAHGEFGYFPTYALGTAYAAQMWDAMQKDFDASAAISALDIKAVTDWLKEKVHRHSSLLEQPEIFANFTDEGFSPTYYVAYLKDKYEKIYQLTA